VFALGGVVVRHCDPVRPKLTHEEPTDVTKC